MARKPAKQRALKEQPKRRIASSVRRKKVEPPPQVARSVLVLINQLSGTVRSRGADKLQALLETELAKSFSSVEVKLFEGDVEPPLKKAIAAKSHDVIIAGGGDGTIASAAALLMNSDITMGALPLGTMNLFVQALGFSPVVEDAIRQFDESKAVQVDVGFANDRLFLHQVSFGLQPRMARLREKIGYSSRFTKMFAAARAFALLAMKPRSVSVNLDADGSAKRVRTPLLIVSNNPLGRSGHAALPLALDTGKLGLYVLNDFSISGLFRLAKDYLANRLIDNPAVEARIVSKVEIARRGSGKRKRKTASLLSSMDGEVVLLESPVSVTIKPKALKILALNHAPQPLPSS